MTLRDKSWEAFGLCGQLPFGSDLWNSFFGKSAKDRRGARNLCLSGGVGGSPCPVKEQCLRDALEEREIWGIRGGCDESELRRALGVDSSGDKSQRSRWPQCPSCHARPSRLQVIRYCAVNAGSHRAGRRERTKVECRECGFFWHSKTSAVAVAGYWRERRQRDRGRTNMV